MALGLLMKEINHIRVFLLNEGIFSVNKILLEIWQRLVEGL